MSINSVTEWSNLNVLVVEDTKSMRDLMVEILQAYNFNKIVESPDGLDAWNQIKEELENGGHIDLIISDINMPRCSGLTLLDRVRSNEMTSKIPFLIVSTESEKSLVLDALALGASNYIVKPFDKEIIKRKLIETLYY